MSQRSPYVNHLLFVGGTMLFCKTNSKNCRALEKILRRYELSSGQSINLDKSIIMFSSKTSDSIMARVQKSLGIDKEGDMGKYLGLPKAFGRKKKEMFSRVWWITFDRGPRVGQLGFCLERESMSCCSQF